MENVHIYWCIAGDASRLGFRGNDRDFILIGDILSARCIYTGKTTSRSNDAILKAISQNAHRVKAWVIGANDMAVLSGERDVAQKAKVEFMRLVKELRPCLAHSSKALCIFPSVCMECRALSAEYKCCTRCEREVTPRNASKYLQEIRQIVCTGLPLLWRSHNHFVKYGSQRYVLPYYVYPAYQPNMRCISTIAVHMCKQMIESDETNVKQAILDALCKRFKTRRVPHAGEGYLLQPAPLDRVRVDTSVTDIESLVSEYRKSTGVEITKHIPEITEAINAFIQAETTSE